MQKPFDLTFAVGPTQLSTEIKADAQYAFTNNLLSISHRGSEFTNMSKHTFTQLRSFLNIPETYEIFLTSSATESWEICAKNLVENEAFCFISGHFSNAFVQCLKSWGKNCIVNNVNWGELNDFKNTVIPDTCDLITLCHNETSTGVTCASDDIKHLKTAYPDKILAVDITSSVGCSQYTINDADVWYFSVQKGLGLPSGLGVMVVSKQAIERSKHLLTKKQPQGFFNFTNMKKQMGDGKFQTICTPNILAIYLLGKQLERLNKTSARKIQKNTEERAKRIYAFFDAHKKANPYIKNLSYRSPYTLCIEMEESVLAHYKQKAALLNIQLGAGYGELKNTCIRIANYPAITEKDINTLLKIFSD
ncbi:MAG: phosphoserine aminotransferase [Alphaproteobacteria bacterium]|jgi:phosphoserine aminotransferase